jgi:uncharacterized protein
VDERNGDVMWEIWAEGFDRSMDLAAGAWEGLARNFGDDGPALAVMTLMSLLDAADAGNRVPRKVRDELAVTAPDLIPVLIKDLYDVWIAGKPSVLASLPSVPAAKPGRNDPCLCGSGKKFKKCYGAAA